MNHNEKSTFRLRTEQLHERTFQWASRILELCPRSYPDDPSRVIWRQLIRAAPSASGNLEEADQAFSDGDFLYRMKVVLKETNEARRWLRFILKCKLANYARLGNLPDEAHQLASIFATIYINRKKNIDAKKVARLRREVQRRPDPKFKTRG
jgi:four helix bundle protein